MNESIAIPLNYSPNKQIIKTNFKSLWVEEYFFRAFIDDFNFDNFNPNRTYTFRFSAESLSVCDAEILKKFYLTFRGSAGSINAYDFIHKSSNFYANTIFMGASVSFTDNNSHDPQKATYQFDVNGKALKYFKLLKDVGYDTIDWRVLKSLTVPYAHLFYRYMKLSQKNQVMTFAFTNSYLLRIFKIKELVLKLWRRNENNFLAEILEEITNHPTHPIAVEYSTNQYFDKNIPEDRNFKYLYFKILAEEQPLVQTLNPSPFISMKPIYRLIANLKNQSQQGILYLFVAFIGLMLGNASALVDTIAESLMIIPCITVYLLVCVRLIYRHLHPSQT